MKTVTSNRPKIIYFFIVCAVLLSALLFSGSIYITPPWKITDPDNPKFDPLTFDFRDYTQSKNILIEQCAATKKVIRAEMNRDTVERILVKSAKAKKKENNLNNHIIQYLSPVDSGTIFTFIVIPEFYGGLIISVTYTDDDLVDDVSCIYLMGPSDFALHRKLFFIEGAQED